MRSILKLLRVYQWPKNLLVFAGILFVFPDSLVRIPEALLLFIAFCAASSAVYIINDLADKNRDAKHPKKRHRPIANGSISPKTAVLIAFIALVIASSTFIVSPIAGIIVALYLAFNIAYSAGLKHVPYLDVLILASGYVLRVLAGTEGLGIPISEWMFIVAFFAALMIGLGKRYAETTLHGSRPSTKDISAENLKLMTTAAATLTIATYAIYAQAHTSLMLLSIIPFTTAILRYIPLIETEDDPTKALFTSRTVLISGAIYGLIVVLAQI
jgi:decaprenyl-phosphate phosphoribosyltransferase